MKELPVRKLDLVTIRNPLGSVIVPFMLIVLNKPTAKEAARLGCVWLRPRYKKDPPHNEDVLIASIPVKYQTIDEYTQLPSQRLFGSFGLLYYRPNIVGVRNLLENGELRKGDEGECFLFRAEKNDLVFEGVFADSEGAAERWLKAA